MSDPTNEAIARWMGEIHCEKPCAMNIPCERCGCEQFPAYDADPAAALRVLARMNKVRRHYELDNDADGAWQVWLWDGDVHHIKAKSPSPCAAICAAWAAEFGGGG